MLHVRGITDSVIWRCFLGCICDLSIIGEVIDSVLFH